MTVAPVPEPTKDENPVTPPLCRSQAPDLGTRGAGKSPRLQPSPPPTRSQMRKFCRDHFLSSRRMREWQDIHEEIRAILEELEGFARNEVPASYEALHRALLSGYLSHIARKKEKNLYLGSKNRQLMLFPGSGLFSRGGAWIMSAEQVQTTRLFARTAATIEPEWIEESGETPVPFRVL